jgi:hypothetical protein
MPLIIPSKDVTARLRRVNSGLDAYKKNLDVGQLALAAAAALEDQEYRKLYSEKRRGKGPVQSANDLTELMWGFLYFLLYRRDYVAAAMVLWESEVFTPEPECVQTIWDGIFKERMIGIIGGGGLGKTYSPSAWVLLDWLLDPEWTRVQLASNTEDHLIKNLYADIVRLHTEASLPLPGQVDAESISLNKKKGMGIFILTIPGGPKSAGKIKGAHTKPRPEHPLFGRRSRLRMIVDEGQEVAQNIYTEIPNRFSTVLPGDVEHIKFMVCANPKDPYSPFGQTLKPKGSWDTITLTTNTWRSEKEWFVISLNAMQHENVVQRRIVYPGFVTYAGVQNWLAQCNGDPEHPDMYTYVYGKFPPQGTTRAIVQTKDLERSRREWVFDGPTENFAFSDYAFTGDLPTIGTGRSGHAVAYIDQGGQKHELTRPGSRIQIDLVAIMPRGDTQDLTDEVLSRLKDLSIKPWHYGDDRTGVGQGVHDLVRRQWKQKIGPYDPDAVPDGVEGYDLSGGAAPTYGIHFGQEGTRNRVADEDTQLPVDMYDGIRSEVWYVFGRLCELDVIGFGKGVDAKTIEELASRRGGRPVGKGKKLAVESKEVYKARTGNPSPDRADAVTGLVHVMRVATDRLIPKARGTEEDEEPDRPHSMEIESWGTIEMHGMDGPAPLSLKD